MAKEFTPAQVRQRTITRMAAAAKIVADLHAMGHTKVEIHSLSHRDGSDPIVYVNVNIEHGVNHDMLVEIVRYGESKKIQITGRNGENVSLCLWPGGGS